jgi:hypothetical protein
MPASMADYNESDSIEDMMAIFEKYQVSSLRTSIPLEPFPFLRLPAELRNSVYEHIMADEVGMRRSLAISRSRWSYIENDHQPIHP